MDKKMTFNDDVKNYDKYRPNYPDELFNDIIRHLNNSLTNALEIGAGTGQATNYFANLGVDITAIDIGENMVDYLSNKFNNYPNVNCICTSFEDYKCGCNKYDLVYSATAFHWLDEKTALSKVKNILKDNGIIALFWNHPFVGRKDNIVHNEIRKVYDKYRPNDETPKEFSVEDTNKYKNLLKEFAFTNIAVKLYYRERRFTANEYVHLLNTYSDHRMLPFDIKDKFESELYSAIKHNGNEIIIYDTIDLYLGRKND